MLVSRAESRRSRRGITIGIPDAQWKSKATVYGALTYRGQSYVFSLADLPQTFAAVQTRETLVFGYLTDVTRFLVDSDVLSLTAATQILTNYQAGSQAFH
jgi:hypothetical protein